MEIRIIKDQPIKKGELRQIAKQVFGNLVKAVVDVEQEIIAMGGEFHSDGETALMEQEGSQREHTWGINLYLDQEEEKWVEFDSMVNLKPSFGNRTRSVENPEVREKIKEIVKKLIQE